MASHLVAATPGGEVVHGDCGEGALLAAVRAAGVAAHGAEPRGAVALGALERGHSVSVCETADELSARPPASLGGMVLSGVVDRLPLTLLLALLAQARRTLAPGAPLVVVVPAGCRDEPLGVVARDLAPAPCTHRRGSALGEGRLRRWHATGRPSQDDGRLFLSVSLRR